MSSIFTIEKLYKAYQDCIKGKKNTANALAFELNREKNLISLLEELKSNRYEISRHICFVVTRPVAREVFAADFRDRVVHHLLYNELYDIFDKSFIEDSYANRKNKGTHAAVYKVKDYVKSHKYYLKLDIQSFFCSIDRDILYSIIENSLKDLLKKIILQNNKKNHTQNYKRSHRACVKNTNNDIDEVWLNQILWLCRKIIFHDPVSNFIFKGPPELRKLIPGHKSLFFSRHKGLPIGNLTSQFFANIYLNELDRFVIGFGLKYARYVDDFIILGNIRSELASLVKPIDSFLHTRLNLNLHHGKIRLQDCRKGVDFLGYFIKPTHTLVRQNVVRRFKYKFEKIMGSEDGLISLCDIPICTSYYGHFSHASSYNLLRKFGMTNLY